MSDPIHRRQFVKQVVLASAATFVPGRMWTGLAAAEIMPAAESSGILRVNFSDFPEINQVVSSTRIGLNRVLPDHFPDGRFYPILINHLAGTFHVLDSECRHASCVVPKFDLLQQGSVCPCHQSRYGFDGAVLAGPATEPLRKYDFTPDSEGLSITVPGIHFSMTTGLAPLEQGNRLEIRFLSRVNVTYELFRRTIITDPWEPATFSSTKTGPATETAFEGEDRISSIYVETSAGTGFYELRMKVLLV